jgi:hypothetical protein
MSASGNRIEITRFVKKDKPVLKGFFSIKIPQYAGLCINDLSYFQKGNQRWISYPQKPYEKDGEKKYANVIFFEDKAMQDSILKALDEYLVQNNAETFKDGQFIPF